MTPAGFERRSNRRNTLHGTPSGLLKSPEIERQKWILAGQARGALQLEHAQATMDLMQVVDHEGQHGQVAGLAGKASKQRCFSRPGQSAGRVLRLVQEFDRPLDAFLRADIQLNILDFTVRADDGVAAQDTHVRFAEYRLLAPRAVGFGHLMVFIRD